MINISIPKNIYKKKLTDFMLNAGFIDKEGKPSWQVENKQELPVEIASVSDKYKGCFIVLKFLPSPIEPFSIGSMGHNQMYLEFQIWLYTPKDIGDTKVELFTNELYNEFELGSRLFDDDNNSIRLTTFTPYPSQTEENYFITPMVVGGESYFRRSV